MSVTRRYRIATPELHAETVVAFLSELPFTSFEVLSDSALAAYVAVADDGADVRRAVEQLAERFGFTFAVADLPDVNYNAVWERDYPAVEIDDWLRIRAPFHEAGEGFAHELVVQPEMSFGTGHHATTYLLASWMRERSPFGKTCFDFGTGTGVLAILAARLGAARVVATDIDARCVESAAANAERNGVRLAEVRLGTQADLPAGPFDLVLANINRSVLVEALPALARRLTGRGELWLSGILTADVALLTRVAAEAGLACVRKETRDGWVAMRLHPTR